MIGDEIYTPNTPGDALRYMNDPTEDGRSRDYYPERYTGFEDNGGVHWNSGIANLAFYLMVEGGSHPRGKTNISVPSIGMIKAEQIFYRAQTEYLGPSSNFEAARNATAQAAADLYGAVEVSAVHDAWCAVGVPGCPSQPPTGGSELENGVAKTGLSGSQGEQLFFEIDLPTGATNLRVAMSGGSGDPDLYLREAAKPTTTAYDCRPYEDGPNEVCTESAPGAGTWHVMVRGFPRSLR